MKNELENITANQTPIEIALGIDKNGMTTAKKLYEFLELNPAHYARWCRTNITENEFAEENADYWAFTFDGERGFNPNPTQDFKLTASFAKKLSMLQKNERGEQARNYFIKVEGKLKEVVKEEKISSKPDRTEIMLMNARTRQADLYYKLSQVETLSPTYKNILVSKAAETLSGESILPLQKVERKTYSAEEIGKKFGISANKVGRIANKHHLKIEEYGEYQRDKSKYSAKEVDVWMYYDTVIPVIAKILDTEVA